MLQLKNLTIYRHGKTLCRDLFLDIGKGACLIIAGKNGSGKSSLLGCLMGQVKPTSGQVLLDHYDVHGFGAREKKMFLQSSGIVLQQESLRPFDSVTSLLSKTDKKECSDLLSMFHIPESALVHQLSFSQRRNLELMLSILKHPKLIIWDEPFIGFDQESQEKWKSVLLQQKSQGITIVIATNQLDAFRFLNPEKVIQL